MSSIPSALRAFAMLAIAGTCITAQSQQQPSTSSPDAKVVGDTAQKPKTPAQLQDQAWTILTDAATDDKHPEQTIQALAAVGLMGGSPRSLGIIKTAMQNKDIDIRVAAALAAGQTRSPNITSALREMLDDKEPAVDFVAALTLWKMHDHAGEDVLRAVADGDRKTSGKFLSTTTHKLNKQLHDPGAMAMYGATQGAYMLLGPFGIGLTAFQYLHTNGGDAARVSAIEAIAQNHTAPIRAALIDATTDKDFGVRTAACKALARYKDKDVPPALAMQFDDSKAPVRLTAAAAYLISTGAVAGSPAEGDAVVRSRAK